MSTILILIVIGVLLIISSCLRVSGQASRREEEEALKNDKARKEKQD